MKKIFFFLLWYPLVLSPGVSLGQFQIRNMTISSQGVLVSNTYTNSDTPDSWNTSDTIVTDISITSDSGFSDNGDSISSLRDHSGNFPNNDWKKEIKITIDSVKKLMSVDASYILTQYPNPLSQEYSNIVGKRIAFRNAPFTIAKNADTIILVLNGKELSNINLVEDDYTETYTRLTAKRFDYSTILNIPTNATLSLEIVGSFPLAVANRNKEYSASIIINSASKILKCSTLTPNQNQILSCFDILGRKHDLEFLGSDNSSATYSVRSLRPGVYFVSDDRETVKFMISE